MCALLQIFQGLPGDLRRRGLLLGVFFADFGDGNQTGIRCAMDDVATAESGHGNGAVGDFHRAEAKGLGMLHVIAAMVLKQCDFQQGAAGESQYPVLGQ